MPHHRFLAPVIVMARSIQVAAGQTLDWQPATDPHLRHLYALITCDEGRIVARHQDDEHRIGPGDVLLIDPGYRLVFSSLTRGTILYFALVPLPATGDHCRVDFRVLIQPPLRTIFGHPLPRVFSADDRKEASRLVRSLHRYYCFEASRLWADARLHSWLVDVAGRYCGGQASERSFVEQVNRLMDLHLGDHVCLASIAAMMGISRQTLFNRYRRECGCSPGQVQDDLRLERAYSRLLKVHRPADVARECGFRSAAAFGRWFKQRCGITPGAWQKARTGPLEADLPSSSRAEEERS